jgi:hypothetical protein
MLGFTIPWKACFTKLKDAYENSFLERFKECFLDIQERTADLG